MTAMAGTRDWTAADMVVRPDFLVIGAMKAASSTVCAYLEDHPDVFMVAGGEPDFFNRDENWTKGPDWYAEKFAGRGAERLCGEGSNGYSFGARWPRTAERIAACLPAARIVYTVRHPIDRAASAWVQRRKNGRDAVPPTFERAILEAAEEFVDQSLYWSQLQRYRAVIPDERIFVGFLEDMRADQEAFFARLCAFLGLPPAPQVKRPHANPTAGKKVASPLYSRLRGSPAIRLASRLIPKQLRDVLVETALSERMEGLPALSPAARASLAAILRPDAEALLAHCGKPLDFWRLD